MIALPSRRRRHRAFTLVELLTASTVFVILLGFLLLATNQTTRTWRRATQTLETFRSAREVFDVVRRQLGEATLNPYWAYQYQLIGGEAVPGAYRRESDLHFLCGPDLAGTSHALFFQAPQGATRTPQKFGAMNQLLNDLGFYITYGPDTPWRPSVAASLPVVNRYRLIQLTRPSEESGPFSRTRADDWYTSAVDATASGFAERNVPLGEDIIAIAFLPKRSPADEAANGKLPGGFTYDSRAGAANTPQPVTANQLPPLVEVILIAVERGAAARLAQASGATPPEAISKTLENRLEDATLLETDLEEIATALRSHGLEHRVFRATVPIQAAKWSEN